MVAQEPLELSVQVRILASQPHLPKDRNERGPYAEKDKSGDIGGWIRNADEVRDP